LKRGKRASKQNQKRRQKPQGIGKDLFPRLRPYFHLCAGIFLIILGVLGFDNSFLYDDYTHILNANMLRQIPSLSDFVGSSWVDNGPTWAYRPILSLTYFIEGQLWGFNAGIMRAVNIMIHVMNAALLFLIMNSLCSGTQYLRNTQLMLIGLFLFHPVAWHSVLYVSARSTLLVSFFLFLTIHFYLARGPTRYFVFLTALLAMLTKETGILAIPFALILGAHRLKEDISIFWRTKRNRQLLYFVLLPVLVSILVYRRGTYLPYLNLMLGKSNFPHEFLPYLMTQFQSILKYFELILFPWNWAFSHDIRLLASPFGVKAVLTATSVSLVVIALLLKIRKRDLLFRSLLVFLLSFAPAFLFPREILANEQRCYMGLVLFYLVILNLFDSGIISGGRIRKITQVLIVLSFLINSGILLDRVKEYRTVRSLMERDIEVYPGNIAAMTVLGLELSKENKYERAAKVNEEVLNIVSELAPRSNFFRSQVSRLFVRAGGGWLNTGKLDQAKRLLGKCNKLQVKADRCSLLKSQILISEGQYKSALVVLKSLPDDDYYVQFTMIQTYLVLGQQKNAWELMERTYKRDPYKLALNLTMVKYLMNQKKYSAARTIVNEAIERFQKARLTGVDRLQKLSSEILKQSGK